MNGPPQGAKGKRATSLCLGEGVNYGQEIQESRYLNTKSLQSYPD